MNPDELFWFWTVMALCAPVWVAAAYLLIIEPLFGFWLHPNDWSRVDPRKWLQVRIWYWRNKIRSHR